MSNQYRFEGLCYPGRLASSDSIVFGVIICGDGAGAALVFRRGVGRRGRLGAAALAGLTVSLRPVRGLPPEHGHELGTEGLWGPDVQEEVDGVIRESENEDEGLSDCRARSRRDEFPQGKHDDVEQREWSRQNEEHDANHHHCKRHLVHSLILKE